MSQQNDQDLVLSQSSKDKPITSKSADVGSADNLVFSLGHTSAVQSVAWSPDGRLVLSGSSDKTVRLWEASTGKCLRVLEGHTDAVLSVAWSPDGQQALSGSDDKTVRLWEAGTGNCLRVLEGHTAAVLSVAWSPDGQQALSGSLDNTVRFWEVGTGNCQRVLEGHTTTILNVAWSPDGQQALAGCSDHTVRLWEAGTGTCLRVLKGHKDTILSVAWSPDGQQALSGSSDKMVRVWETGTGTCLRVLKGHTAAVYSVGWSPDGQQALSGSSDHTVRLWEAGTGRCLRLLEGHTAAVSSMAWSRDGQQALSGASDNKVCLWHVGTGKCLRVLEGHTDTVLSVAWSSDGQQALSGSSDKMVRVWHAETGTCLRALEGHTDAVVSVAWSPDGRLVLSGSSDKTVRLWEAGTGTCLRVFEGHTDTVFSVAWSRDGQQALSGSSDKTVRLWEAGTGKCLCILEGHSAAVYSVAWSPDGQQALSGSSDKTVRLWEARKCLRVLEGHTDAVLSVAWSPDGRQALSGSSDKTVRLWEAGTGNCLCILEGHTDAVLSVAWSPDGKQARSAARNGVWRVWNLATGPTLVSESVTYTNAKVLIVGDTHAGKSALTHRLAKDEWMSSEGSTVGVWCTQLQLKGLGLEAGVEQEIWLWDFGGQADQRLIHQLYMDRTALILLLFDADQEDVLPGLRDWQSALRRCVKTSVPSIVVAGRIDAGFRASRAKLHAFAQEQGLAYHETSSKSGEGCAELRDALIDKIPWKSMEARSSPRIFKSIKDEILKLRDEGDVLHTFKELRDLLRRRLPHEASFTDNILKTVISLLDGPGVVKELDYGTYILLAPEWVNTYAQAVIRTLRAADNELGVLPLRSIAEGRLIYQTIGRDGETVSIERRPTAEERVILGEMEKQLIERRLCLRQGNKLVFPSHCGRDHPAVVKHPSVVVSYVVKGYLDDIYATLVVKLADSQCFQLKSLWRDAADFATLVGDHQMGIKLTRETANLGEISVYFGKGLTELEQIFANFIHLHLQSSSEEVQRLRHYVCPKCFTAKGNSEALMKKLLDKKQEADTECDGCGNRFPLWDDLEKLFASDEVRNQVEQLQADDVARLSARRKGKLLVLEVSARITSANQKCMETPQDEDDGIDMMIEFTDDDGHGTGKQLYLQLKAGNSHLIKRKTDGVEFFAIKKPRWVKTWTNQPYPVMLVIGSFSNEDDRAVRRGKLEFSEVRWMEISSVLKRLSKSRKKKVTRIEFKGEPLDMASVRRWRDRALAGQLESS